MAKVYNNGGDIYQPIVMEDPRTGNDGFWLWGRRHDKDTLTPQFGAVMNWASGTLNGFSSWKAINRMTTTSYYHGQNQLLLKKMTVHCSEHYSTSAERYNYLDDSAWVWMDATTEANVSYTTWTEHDDGNGNKRLALWGSDHQQYGYLYGYTDSLTSSQNLDEVRLSANTPVGTNSTNWQYTRHLHSHPSWVSSNGYIFGLSANSPGSSSYYFYPAFNWIYAGNNWPHNYGTANYTTPGGSLSTYWGVQVLGNSYVDGKPILCGVYCYTGTSSNGVKLIKGTLGSGTTWTELANLQSGTPSASGTHAGGNNLNGDTFYHNCSKTFTDPRDSDKKAFYKTYFDTSGDFHPFVVTWNTTNDTFAIETGISITGDKSSTHASLLSSTFDSSSYRCDAIITETWATSSYRYVGYFPLDGKAIGTDSAKRTVIVYRMDASDPTALTYHSKITFSDDARNIVWLNDDRTLVGVFFKSNFKIYSFSDASGWAETTSIAHKVTACGRDADDRIWYVHADPDIGQSYPALYLLTPTLPVSVTIAPANASYTYSGSNISTSIDVSALNSSGTRIAASVKLVIEGSSMTFTDGTTTKTVTTLTSGELNVGTTITGSGYTNVTASIVV